MLILYNFHGMAVKYCYLIIEGPVKVKLPQVIRGNEKLKE